MPFLKQVKPLWDRSPLTLAELAELCNISESSASRYLNGKVSPPADVAERILEVLGAETAADDDEGGTPVSARLIDQIREIYQSQIATLQATFASQMAALQASYAAQIADLRRDKRVLFCTVVALIVILIYFILDALHGNWGLIRYAMVSTTGGTV